MAKGKRKAKRAKAKRAKGSSKSRKAAARKAAKTRAAKHAARVRAGKKGARTRARKGGGKRKGRKGGRRAREAMEPRKTKKRKGGKRKGSKKKGKRRGKRVDLVTQLQNAKAKINTIEARYAAKHLALQQRIVKSAGAERERLLLLLNKLKIEQGKEINRIKTQSAAKLSRLEAAEKRRGKGRRKGGKRKGGKRKGAKRNPIGSGGGHEYAATAAGIFMGLLLTIVPYRLLRSHALTPVGSGQGGSGGIDAPKQGDVPNLLAAQQPFWSNLKWRGLLAAGTVLVVDIGLPVVAAAYTDSDGWKAMWQAWWITGTTLVGAKVVTDVAAVSLKSTLIGQRMFATENTARDVRAQSVNAQLPAISVAPGLGMPGLTGYGKAKCTKNLGAGAACCCDECGGARGKTVVKGAAPGTGEPITGTTPIPAAPNTPAAPPLDQANPANPGGGLPLGGPTRYSGAGGNVTPINKFAIPNRFDGSVLRK